MLSYSACMGTSGRTEIGWLFIIELARVWRPAAACPNGTGDRPREPAAYMTGSDHEGGEIWIVLSQLRDSVGLNCFFRDKVRRGFVGNRGQLHR